MSSSAPRSRLRYRVGVILCGVVLALAGAACGASGASSQLSAAAPGAGPVGTVTLPGPTSTVRNGATSTSSSTTITGPTQATPGSLRATIHAGGDAPVAPTSTSQGFLGLATELSTITTLSGTPGDLDMPLVNLLKNLSPGAPFLLRLGGDSADWSWWAVPGMRKPAAIRYTLGPSWASSVKALLGALDAKALLGVNLELDSAKVAAYEAARYESALGPKLIDALELGNEPELYAAFNYYRLANGTGVKGRVRGHYTIADYGRDFSHIAAGLGHDPIAGPSSGSPHWLPALSTMLAGLPARLKLVTVHAYPLKRCSASTHLNVSDFFSSDAIAGLAGRIQAMVRAAAAHHKALRVDEINGISCGGEAGVSNTQAEALWALNVLPALWRAGVQGVNWQTVDGNLNEMISAHRSGGHWSVAVQPEYYALRAFAEVAPAGAHLLKLAAPRVPKLYQYAVRDPSGAERVVLTNVGAGARTVGVSLAGVRGTGAIALLAAPSLGATHGTSLGGQTVSATTGQLSGTPADTLVTPNAKGVYAVRVPPHAAAILTVGS